MKLYIYQGLNDENIPFDTTHIIVEENVTIIKRLAFDQCQYLVSIIMGDSVKRIQVMAFNCCRALRFIRFSKNLEYIGECVFYACRSLETLFLPPTVKSIDHGAFLYCRSLVLLILPNGINLSNVYEAIICGTAIEKITEAAGIDYERLHDNTFLTTRESSRRVNEWLFHHMDESPFHKLCYSSSITTQQINDYLNENGIDSALQIDTIHGMTPLHMLTMNPHAPAVAITALLNTNMEVAFFLDNRQKTPLDCARDSNIGGLIGMIAGLCNQR